MTLKIKSKAIEIANQNWWWWWCTVRTIAVNDNRYLRKFYVVFVEDEE